MDLEKLKIGVVGVGKMGEYHLEKYLRVPDADLVGFYEADEKRCQQIESKYPVQGFSSLSELLFEADALSIASPTPTHFSIAKQALLAGVHVLIEKPMCDTEEQALELIKIANEQNLVLQVGFIERFRLEKLKRSLDTFSPWLIEAHWLSPTLPREPTIDVIHDLVVHPLDLVLSMLASDVRDVSVVGRSIITPLIDFASIRLEFSNGTVANLSGSRVARHRERRLDLYLARSHVHFNFLTNHVDVLEFVKGQPRHTAFGLDDSHGLAPDILFDQCKSFVHVCKNKLTPVVTGTDGLRVLRIANQIKEKISGDSFLDRPVRSPAEMGLA